MTAELSKPESASGDATSAAAGDARVQGVLLASLSVALFSSFTLASRLGFSASLSWPDLAALRFGVGGIVLLPILLRRGLLGVSWRNAFALAFLGGLGFAVLAYTGFSLAPAAHGAALLHGTLPLFTFAILAAKSRRGGLPYRPFGLALIAAGVVLMAADSIFGASVSQLQGDLLLLLASASWSAYGVLVRSLNLPTAHTAALVACISMCCFVPAYAVVRGGMVFSLPFRELAAQALVQGVLIGAVSIFVYTRAVAALGPATTALFTAAVPCTTALAAIPLLHETPSLLSLCGIGAVTLGVFAARRTRRTKASMRAGTDVEA